MDYGAEGEENLRDQLNGCFEIVVVIFGKLLYS